MAKSKGLYRINIFAPYRRLLKKARKIATQTEALKDKYRNMSNKDLSNMTNIFLNELQQGKSLDDIAADAFAVAREACFRVHKLFAYKVQIIGAAIVHFGDFAEMCTGEGKTLVLVIVAYLNALLKQGIHIVTVNEYLVQRDAKFCAQALNPLGITVGYNISNLSPKQKKDMFACDITYTTNSELGFDYLRDNMVTNFDDKVIRNLSFAIVDEGDSVLIDEARTPLIISGQPKRDVSMYIEVDQFAKTLKPEDYKIDRESNSIVLTDDGVLKAEARYKLKNLYSIENSDLIHKIKNAMMANFIFELGVEYIVKDDKILLVDQFTGRILEGRSYNAGLHQAIQAKEYVKIEPENVIVATVTYQSFFRLYKKLAGVSGTAMTEAEEFIKIYNMVVVPIPTNRPNIRKDFNDYVFANKISK
jgi:preprotein translocase subunit SecA